MRGALDRIPHLGEHGKVLVLHDGCSVGGQTSFLQRREKIVQVDTAETNTHNPLSSFIGQHGAQVACVFASQFSGFQQLQGNEFE